MKDSHLEPPVNQRGQKRTMRIMQENRQATTTQNQFVTQMVKMPINFKWVNRPTCAKNCIFYTWSCQFINTISKTIPKQDLRKQYPQLYFLFLNQIRYLYMRQEEQFSISVLRNSEKILITMSLLYQHS